MCGIPPCTIGSIATGTGISKQFWMITEGVKSILLILLRLVAAPRSGGAAVGLAGGDSNPANALR